MSGRLASRRVFAALSMLLLLGLALLPAETADSATLVPQDRETRRQYDDLGATGGEIIFWSGDVVRFSKLLASEQGRCASLDMKLCLSIVSDGAASTVDLVDFSILEYLTPKVFKLTDRFGRFYLAQHYSPQGAKESSSQDCPPGSTVPQENNLSLVYGVFDSINNKIVYNAVPFCRVKKLTIEWGAAARGKSAGDSEDEEDERD